jgi:hypothetical protein
VGDARAGSMGDLLVASKVGQASAIGSKAQKAEGSKVQKATAMDCKVDKAVEIAMLQGCEKLLARLSKRVCLSVCVFVCV